MYKILVVDDEVNIRRVVREYAKLPKRKTVWKPLKW